MTVMAFNLPIRIDNHGNAKGAAGKWARIAASGRARAHRSIAKTIASQHLKCTPIALPCTVRLVRLAPGMLDTDNLAHAFKHMRDGIADAFGCGDGPNGPITWEYAQEKTKRERKPRVSRYAARVEVTSG